MRTVKQLENSKWLLADVQKKIDNGKRLTKSEMAYQISRIEPYSSVAISWDYFLREDVVSKFNKMFGTKIN